MTTVMKNLNSRIQDMVLPLSSNEQWFVLRGRQMTIDAGALINPHWIDAATINISAAESNCHCALQLLPVKELTQYFSTGTLDNLPLDMYLFTRQKQSELDRHLIGLLPHQNTGENHEIEDTPRQRSVI